MNYLFLRQRLGVHVDIYILMSQDNCDIGDPKNAVSEHDYSCGQARPIRLFPIRLSDQKSKREEKRSKLVLMMHLNNHFGCNTTPATTHLYTAPLGFSINHNTAGGDD